MKIFENFNQNSNCPICKTNKEGKAVLIPIDGTNKDNISEAIQVHLDCIELRYALLLPGIYQKFNE